MTPWLCAACAYLLFCPRPLSARTLDLPLPPPRPSLLGPACWLLSPWLAASSLWLLPKLPLEVPGAKVWGGAIPGGPPP